MTVNYDTYLHAVATDYRKTVPGSEVNLFAFLGNIRPAIPAYKPKHNVAINDDTNNAGVVVRKYSKKGGRDVTTILVADNTEIVAGTTTLTVDGRAYTFVAAITTGNQILKGSTANDTAANIQARLNNRTGYIATVSTATVTLKGLQTGSLTVTTNNTDALTISASTAIKASLKEVYDGDRVIENTENIWEVDVLVADSNGDLRSDTVRVVAFTPAITNASTALTTLVARIKAVRAHALAGTEPVGFDSNYEPITLGSVTSKLNATPSAIKDALRGIYGNDPDVAFTISGTKSNILTSTVQGTNYLSYVGNKIQCGVGIESSRPTLQVFFTDDGFPYIDGRGTGFPLGSVDGYKNAKTGTSVTLKHSNNKQPFGTTKTGVERTITWKGNEVYDVDLQKIAQGDANIARDGLYEYIMQGGDSFEVGLIASIVDNLGNQHFQVFYNGLLTKGAETEFTVESAAGINYEYKPQSQPGVADSDGFEAVRVKKALPAYA